ncbi:MAG TPA: helix-turn-helix domain-containing protein [Bacillota bacterium]|nr:helix-turn-helix domain-containing protein [Bacillota bacterium]
MDSYERMNEVISYIEDNITAEIDYSHIAKVACCPTHQFPRIFAFLADITLSEYIRRRRLSLAALEIQQTKSPIIDIALKYGYDSHASFSRAFQEHHKMAPSSARDKNAILNIFPRISFRTPTPVNQDLIYRIEKGKMKMASVKKIEFIPFGPYKIVGKAIRTRPMTQEIPTFWAQCFSNGTYEKLLEMKDYHPIETDDAYIGYMRDFDSQGESFTYLVGFFMKPDTPVPDGYVSYEIPACTIAQAWIEGEEYEIYANSRALTVNAIKQNGYEVDWENFFQCEVYTDLRFGIPKNKGEKILVLDFYVPCKKAEN